LRDTPGLCEGHEGAWGHGMGARFKYAIVLSLAVAGGFLAIGSPVTGSLRDFIAAWSEPEIVRIDSAAAARVDEQLDYRIAQRRGSLEGWRAFLDAHGDGANAQSARAQIARRLLASGAPAAPDAEVSNDASPDAIAESDAAARAGPSHDTEVATATSDEVCSRDGARLERLSRNPASDEIRRFANELGCEALRPQLMSLVESVDRAPSAQAPPELPNSESQAPKVESVVAVSPPSQETKVASLDDGAAALAAEPPVPPARVGPATSRNSRPVASPGVEKSTASLHGHQARRHASGCAFKFLCFRRAPPILLALLGEKPKHATVFRQRLASAWPNSLRDR
jgi:hypothetical protein